MRNNYIWEEYARPENEKGDKRTYKDKIIKRMHDMQANHFQMYNYFVFLKEFHDNIIQLFHQNTFFSDAHIILANGFLRWEYPTNNIAFIQMLLLYLTHQT